MLITVSLGSHDAQKLIEQRVEQPGFTPPANVEREGVLYVFNRTEELGPHTNHVYLAEPPAK